MDESTGTRQPARSIAQSRARFVAAIKGGDTEAVATVYANRAMLLAPSAELIRGREAIESFWRAGVDAGVADVELEALEVRREDPLAFEIGRYALLLRPAIGGAVVDRGKYVLVHERQPDGSWLRAVEMFNPESPSACLGASARPR